MTDLSISNQSESCNEEDRRAADRALRESLGYQFNPETGTWQLKPKERRPPPIPPETSRQALCLPDEDYSECVCLLLPGGYATLIDAKYFEWLQGLDWYVMGRSIFYVERRPVMYTRPGYCGSKKLFGCRRIPSSTRMVQMHRLIYLESVKPDVWWKVAPGIPKEKQIDHANRVPWDNRSANLRIATPSQNLHNRAKWKGGSSQYKGVTKLKGKNKWKAQIRVEGKLYNLGTYDDEFKAAQAYNSFVRKNLPEFGYINPLVINGE